MSERRPTGGPPAKRSVVSDHEIGDREIAVEAVLDGGSGFAETRSSPPDALSSPSVDSSTTADRRVTFADAGREASITDADAMRTNDRVLPGDFGG